MRLIGSAALTLALLCAEVGVAGQSVTGDSLRIEYGLVPASTVRAHEEDHEEARMHEGPPRARAAQHLVVSLFDARSGTRIEDAEVRAAVGPLGLEGAPRELERMHAGGVVSYGGYYRIGAPGPYRIRFEITRPGWRDPTIVQVDQRIESDTSQ